MKRWPLLRVELMPVLVLVLVAGGVWLFAELADEATLVLIAVIGALVLSSLLKSGFQRPRPESVPHGSYVYTTSLGR